MNILEVKDLCKTYIVNKRQNNVLKNINFAIGEGEMVAVMGPSGSGKSTLLYTVSGMDDVTAGDVNFCEKILQGWAKENKKLREPRKETARRGQNLMRRLGIIDIADNDINEVSGGQLQRACICRSMMNNPKMIFADEPTGALNRTSSDEVMEELVKLNSEGTTIMLVTHDVKVAAKCTRVMYIVDGNIKGEYDLSDCSTQIRERERALNNWLLELGW